MPYFTEKKQSSIVFINEKNLGYYPESLLSVMWRWHLLSYEEELSSKCEEEKEEFYKNNPCSVDYVSDNNLLELQQFYEKGVWSNPWYYKNAEKHSIMIGEFFTHLWDYFMLQNDCYEDREGDVEEIEIEEESEEEDFIVYGQEDYSDEEEFDMNDYESNYFD